MIDAIDQQIIAELLADGRRPLEQVARKVNLSRPAVHERVRRLEASGVIRGYTLRVDWAEMGFPVLAYVHLRHRGSCLVVGDELLSRTVPGAIIEDCHRIAGDYCLVVWIRATSTLTLQDQIDAFRTHEAVQSTHTTIVLSSLREGMISYELPAGQAPSWSPPPAPQALRPARRQRAGQG